MIPNTARKVLLSGIPGTVSHDSPLRAVSALIKHNADADSCVFGHAFTYDAETTDVVVPGGSGVFAGILIHPHAYAIDQDLARPGQVCEFAEMAMLTVRMSGDPKRGDAVAYLPADGSLTTADTAGAVVIPGAMVSRHPVSVERDAQSRVLAQITLTGPQPVAVEEVGGE